MKIFILIFFSLYILTHCSSQSIPKKEKKLYYTKYFKEKRILTRTQYKHIEINFEKEIFGTKDEIDEELKAIQNENGSYYKVYYALTGQILKYEYFDQGYLAAYAIYNYGNLKTLLAGKLIRIDYYNEKRNQVAYDTIIYGEYGKAIKTSRYILPEKKLKNIF